MRTTRRRFVQGTLATTALPASLAERTHSLRVPAPSAP